MSLDVSLFYDAINDRPEQTVFDATVTHNLGGMAQKAGLYDVLWTPENIGVTHAAGVVPFLEHGLAKLKMRRKYFERFNPPNGWGDYDGFVQFCENYLKACKQFPSAKIHTWR